MDCTSFRDSSDLENNFLEQLEVRITSLDVWLYEVNDLVRKAADEDELLFVNVRTRLEFIGQCVVALKQLCEKEKVSQQETIQRLSELVCE